MPTARELLEQADALMRRNRLAGGDAAHREAAPRSTALSTLSPLPSPRSLQREPIAPPVEPDPPPAAEPAAPEPAMAPGTHEVGSLTAPEAAPQPAGANAEVSPPPAASPQSDAEATEFPVLTQAVAEAAPATPGVLDDLEDDVPVLTDAVEEIDVGSVVESVPDEPSIWALGAPGETSVLGLAPDSVALVPLPQPGPRPEARDPLGLDQPPPGYEANRSSREEQDGATPSTGESATSDNDEPQPVFSASIAGSAPEDAQEAALADAPELGKSGEVQASNDPHESLQPAEAFAPEAAPAEAFEPEAAPAEAVEPEAVEPEAAPAEALEPDAGPAERIESEAMRAEEPPPSSADAPADVPGAADSDETRIRAIAEEIGMQVLQRIDIFTDTTLRTQLGERLRPVVERAAADLVAEINEHIGQLLRAQVAEAIEREIQSWKDRRS